MKDWSKIESGAAPLADFPERLAPFRRKRGTFSGTRVEIEQGLAVVLAGLRTLGSPASDELTFEQLRMLADLRNHLMDDLGTRRAVSGSALRRFCDDNLNGIHRVLGQDNVAAQKVAHALLRAFLGRGAVQVMEEVPPSHAEDPEDLRGLALRWFEDNALLLRESDQIACFWVLGPCVGHQLIPIATRLYHHPSTGPEFAETMEEIFGPEIFERIRAGG